MLYSLTTTPLAVVSPASADRVIQLSAGKFSTAVNVYITPPGSKNVQVILSANGTTKARLKVPHGTSLEAYTDAGTAELAVTKEEMPCPGA